MIYYSHFDRDGSGEPKRLVHHLLETAEAMQVYVGDIPEDVPQKAQVMMLARWIGLCHDFGKYTSFFQHYLQEGKDSGEKKNHSLVSALWGMFVVSQKWQEAVPDKNEAMLLAFAVIRAHHGSLLNPSQDLKNFMLYLRDDLRDLMEPRDRRAVEAVLKTQLPDLVPHRHEIEQEWQSAGIDLPGLEAFHHATQADSEFWTLLRQAHMWLDRAGRKKMLGDFQRRLYLLFSTLIDADKRGAAQIDMQRQRFPVPADSVQRFKSRADFGNVNPQLSQLREGLYHMLEEKALKLPIEERRFTLTAPTGSGKTLAALNFALRRRQVIADATGVLPRIIYALPFTSIIDQNHDVFEKVLAAAGDSAAKGLLKHHHLAQISAENFIEGEKYSLDKLLLLVESWDAEIVVTTFVQLLETLIGNRNRMLKKYHNLYGAILLLDEVQNVPVEYWGLVRSVLNELVEHAGCTVVLMTATQPLIFDRDETTELVDEAENLFAKLDRVQFVFSREKKSLDAFTNDLLANLDGRPTAVILNTIKSSLQVFDAMKEVDEYQVYYLSTNIIPKHRQERIRQIQQKLKNREPVLLVSTQVIEAGVDFDFDRIYRDLAPIDSIVQAAGRANRNAVGSKGQVQVVSLVDDNERQFANWIYGKGHLYVAEELLKDNNVLGESAFFALVQENYQRLVNIQDQSAGNAIYDSWWLGGDFAALDTFKLIDFRPDYVDVFIPVDEDGEKVWDEYQRHVTGEKNLSKRKSAYLELRSRFKQYVMSVPAKAAKLHFWDYCFGDTGKVGYIEPAAVEDNYDPQTGFRREWDDRAMIF